jgi:hypothetical protein
MRQTVSAAKPKPAVVIADITTSTATSYPATLPCIAALHTFSHGVDTSRYSAKGSIRQAQPTDRIQRHTLQLSLVFMASADAGGLDITVVFVQDMTVVTTSVNDHRQLYIVPGLYCGVVNERRQPSKLIKSAPYHGGTRDFSKIPTGNNPRSAGCVLHSLGSPNDDPIKRT